MADNSSTVNDLEERFFHAANHLQSMISTLDSGQLLQFYGLYKQSTVGTCDIPKPNWYQTQAKYKWEAWKALGDMSKHDAMENYINDITKLDPNWEQAATIGGRSWIAVSSLPNTDIELSDSDKTLLDWIKEGNEKLVHDTLLIDATKINIPDENDMMPIHWAADRGNVNIIKCLIENGADINAQDNDGQTPLHYATSCSHQDVVKYLLSVGAKLLKDNEGLTPNDIADENMLAML